MQNERSNDSGTARQRTVSDLLHRGFTALTAGQLDEAAACCRRALEIDPRRPHAHFLVGLIAIERRDTRTAVNAFGSVTRLDPKHAAAWAQLARLFAQSGQPARAEKAVAEAIAGMTEDPVVLDLIGSVQSLLGDQWGAIDHYGRAVAARPGHPPFEIDFASAAMFLGRTDQAEAALTRALATDPGHPQAHWLLSTMKRATDRRHLDTLEQLIDANRDRPQALAFLGYAAGKEYEDLGDWARAFAAFEQGARARRSQISYDEAAEDAMFEALTATFTPDWVAAAAPGDPDSAPIFVIGQPRTGTTLVERIITSHSAVASAGELQQFRLAIRRLAGITSSDRFSAAIVSASGLLDPRALGVAYLRTSEPFRGGKPRFVDKMPTNFLHVPLIAAALPNARIVHLVRDPIDSCFSSYKQLFADAYFHSYDQTEMARHYVRYHRLMETWRRLLPDRIIDVGYEETVADVEATARRLIDALGLPWEDACLDFHRQERAVATASAVQVREPAHTRSVGRWRRYQAALGPTVEVLRRAGLVP